MVTCTWVVTRSRNPRSDASGQASPARRALTMLIVEARALQSHVLAAADMPAETNAMAASVASSVPPGGPVPADARITAISTGKPVAGGSNVHTTSWICGAPRLGPTAGLEDSTG